MDNKELQKILDDHEEWLYGRGGFRADLYGANLRGANLRGANLYGANLCGANLCGADLCDADLRDADLYGANLCGADLCGANLCGADLCDADLRDADLYGANLRGANLRGADLYGANLRGANLRGANLWFCVGEAKHIKSGHIEKYYFAYTSEHLQIGCERHPIEKWWGFSDDQIKNMDAGALEWWTKWKSWLQQLIEISPALPTVNEDD